MASKVQFAKGPSADGSIGFKRQRSEMCPIVPAPTFEYPVDPPIFLGTIRDFKPGRKYYNIRLKDFEPYRALGEPLMLHGPSPYNPQLCSCDRYYVCKSMCVCSMFCRTQPLYAWAKANPEAFKEKQREMIRWKHLWDIWRKQVEEVNLRWEQISSGPRQHLQTLQDEESPIGCADCESRGNTYCKCECDNCCSKYCMGDCYEPDDYDY